MCGSSTTATTQMTQATQKCGNENERTNCCDVSCCPTAPSDWLLLPQAVRRRVPSEISDNAAKVGSVNLAWSGPLAFRSAALATIAQRVDSSAASPHVTLCSSARFGSLGQTGQA